MYIQHVHLDEFRDKWTPRNHCHGLRMDTSVSPSAPPSTPHPSFRAVTVFLLRTMSES